MVPTNQICKTEFGAYCFRPTCSFPNVARPFRHKHHLRIIPLTTAANLKVGLFTVILGGTRSSEFINTYLRDRWHEFSRQNYFDEHGIFMGVMWAGPLLLLGFTMLVSTTRNLTFSTRQEGTLAFWGSSSPLVYWYLDGSAPTLLLYFLFFAHPLA